jgi:hypothetical protein
MSSIPDLNICRTFMLLTIAAKDTSHTVKSPFPLPLATIVPPALKQKHEHTLVSSDLNEETSTAVL